jgi:hypothetical protein
MDGHCLQTEGDHISVGVCVPGAKNQMFEVTLYTAAVAAAGTGANDGADVKPMCTGWMCEGFDPLFNVRPNGNWLC